MAVIQSSIAYSGRNKIGTMVLRTVNGQLIASQYQPNVKESKSPGQVESRGKMAKIVESYSIVEQIVQVGMREFNKLRSKYNEYVSLNKTNAIIEVDNVFTVDWEILQMTKGSLTEIENIVAAKTGTNITFTYSGQNFDTPQNASDTINWAIVAPGLQFSTSASFTTRAEIGTATFDGGIFPTGTIVHAYSFPLNNAKKKGGKTQYLGTFTF